MDEVPALHAVLENVQRLSLTYMVRKDSQQTGIWIAEALSGAIYVLIPQRDDAQLSGGAEHHGHLLLDLLGETIERARRKRRILRGRQYRDRGSTLRAFRLEPSGSHCLCRSRARIHDSVRRASVLALSINGTRRGDDQLPKPFGSLIRHHVQDGRRSLHVGTLVPQNFVHGLGGTGLRGQVHHRIYISELLTHGLAIANVAVDALAGAQCRKLGREIRVRSMNLRLEAVEH